MEEKEKKQPAVQAHSRSIVFTHLFFFELFAAIPCVLYAHYISYIDLTSFTVDESIFILSIIIIGGMCNLWGSSIAAAVLVILPELLRFIGMPSDISANMRQIIYGLALVIMMFKHSKGFIPEKLKQT